MKPGRKPIAIPAEQLRAVQQRLLTGSTWREEAQRLGVATGTLRARLEGAGLGVESALRVKVVVPSVETSLPWNGDQQCD